MIDFDIKADVGFSLIGGLETYLRPKVPLYDDMEVLKEKLYKALKPFMLVTCKILRAEASGMKLQLKHVHIEDVLLDCLEEVNVVVSYILIRKAFMNNNILVLIIHHIGSFAYEQYG